MTMGIKFEFNCTKCGEKCIDTSRTRVPDELTLALSLWLRLCTVHEREFFDSKKLTGHEHLQQVVDNPVIVEGAIVKEDKFMVLIDSPAALIAANEEKSDEPTQFHVEVK
jgi:hypothetical protein